MESKVAESSNSTDKITWDVDRARNAAPGSNGLDCEISADPQSASTGNLDYCEVGALGCVDTDQID